LPGRIFDGEPGPLHLKMLWTMIVSGETIPVSKTLICRMILSEILQLFGIVL
jgi:hypothetical protein